MTNRSEKAKQLYLQAKRNWKPNSLPFFNSESRVPSELLLDVMLLISNIGSEYKHRSEFRMIFYKRLKELLNDKKDFNEKYLGLDIKRFIKNREPKTYLVYFGVPINISQATQLPFAENFTIDNVKFKRISFEQFEKPHKNKECLARYYDKFERNLHQRQDRNYIAKNLYYFKASVSGSNYSDALSSVDNAFRILCTSATVAENSNTLKHSMMGGDLKSRSILFPMGIMLISTKKHESCELAWGSDVRATADQTIEFTTKPNKSKQYKTLKRIWNENTPISKRIKLVVAEYANALHSTEPHIRQLGFWRCLEIATSKNNSSRPEKEIVQIIATHYRKDEAWKQRGEIIKKARNDYVHNGSYLERDEWGSVDRYLNWTQEYLDAVLGMLLVMRTVGIGKKTESEIDAFFDQYPKSNEELNIAKILFQNRTKQH